MTDMWLLVVGSGLWLLANGLSGIALAQQRDAPPRRQDLEPVESALTYHTPTYHSKLRDILLKPVPWDSPVVFLSLPSFELETLVSVHPVGDSHEAVVLLPERQIWEHVSAKDDRRIAVTTTKKALPAKLAERLRQQWRTMLARTCYSDDPIQHLDGVSYLFLQYLRGVGHRGGKASNPATGTRAAGMAEVGLALIAYVQAKPDDEAAALARLGEAMDALDAMLAAVAKASAPAGK